MSFCHVIDIEHDLFRRIQALLFSAINRIFLAFLIANIVKIAIIFVRDRNVSLFDSSYDFLEKFFLQLFRVLKYRSFIGVLSIQILDNFRVVSVTQPEVIVDSCVIMNGQLPCNFLGLGRN